LITHIFSQRARHFLSAVYVLYILYTLIFSVPVFNMFSTSNVGLAARLSAYVSKAQPFNCQIEVPPNPLTAQGLATPYKMSGCNQVSNLKHEPQLMCSM
jgi:hypothetical protein